MKNDDTIHLWAALKVRTLVARLTLLLERGMVLQYGEEE